MFAMAVAVSIKAAAAPSQSMASGKCCAAAAAAAPHLLSAQETPLLWALRWPQYRANKDPIFLLILMLLRESSITAFAGHSPSVQHLSLESQWTPI